MLVQKKPEELRAYFNHKNIIWRFFNRKARSAIRMLLFFVQI